MNSIISIEFEEAPSLGSNGENQSQIDPKLFKAAADGNAEPFKDMAREAIESSLTVQTRNTILHINIICQETENASTKFVEEILEDYHAVRQLFERKKSLIKETDQYGWTPIHYAAYHDQYLRIHVLLEIDQAATNIADKDRKMTALHLAAARGHSITVERILSLAPECYELVDNRGWNFLHYDMVSFTHGELKDLLKYPLARSLMNDGDEKGNSPLHVLAAVSPN